MSECLMMPSMVCDEDEVNPVAYTAYHLVTSVDTWTPSWRLMLEYIVRLYTATKA